MRFSRRASFRRAGAVVEFPVALARRWARKLIEASGRRVVIGPFDMEKHFLELYERCHEYTLVTLENMYGLYRACQHITANHVPGDVVICGVWRGGSAMLCALTLKDLGETDRHLYLYDTYAGMSEPTDVDVLSSTKETARDIWSRFQGIDHNEWVYAPLDEARANLESTGYPIERLHYVIGKVEETIPGTMPKDIALLHLDTDFYESTRHELEHLYPLLSRNGILAIDDYGGWEGARRAVDEHFANHDIGLMLHRLDWSGRMGVKAD